MKNGEQHNKLSTVFLYNYLTENLNSVVVLNSSFGSTYLNGKFEWLTESG